MGENDQKEPAPRPSKPGPLSVIGSVLSAAFGVQSSKNRERDFKEGSHKTFIVAGIVFTVLFIGTVVTIVRLVLQQSVN